MFSCRRNQPSLVDANRPPDTELWYAPPDSSEYDYLVHIYWRGIDPDGIVEQYIWTITDTLDQTQFRWNPAQRAADLRAGRYFRPDVRNGKPARTDSIFSFTAFRNVDGVGLRKNRQAFHIASIDDNGVIDPSPAAVEFVATVQSLPRTRFTTYVTEILGGNRTEVTKPYKANAIDTVGMHRPFRISYNGVTRNGRLRAYHYFPLSAGVTIAGQDVWNTNLADTMRIFQNIAPDTLPSGVFRFAAQVRDDAGAESVIDASRFTSGVVELAVNYDPDTEIFQVDNIYVKGGTAFTRQLDIADAIPDTVPYNSWMRVWYRGKDNPRDSTWCDEVPPPSCCVPNECLKYNVTFERIGDVNGGPSEPGGRRITSRIAWQPGDPEDTNPFSTTDSTSLNAGSQRYRVSARAVDEYGRPDGTPATVQIVGNFPPTLDDISIVNYDGTVINDGDSLVWDFLKPANLQNPPQIVDTLKFTPTTHVRKEFYFVIRGTGHDHPLEADNQGVKAWLYDFRRTDNGEQQLFARTGFWSNGRQTNVLSDTVKAVITYPYTFGEDSANAAAAAAAFRARPTYLDKEYDYSLRGRDLRNQEEFNQFMWLGYGANARKQHLNTYNTSQFGRLSQTMRMRFYCTMIR